jgi:hypothetical protein
MGTGMATTTQEIPQAAWREYFDDLSKTLPTVKATVEIAGRDIGAQVAAERQLLTGISYDHKDDVIVIGLDAPGGLPEDAEHLVYGPQKVFVAAEIDGETVIDIEDSEGQKTIVHVEPVPALPAE